MRTSEGGNGNGVQRAAERQAKELTDRPVNVPARLREGAYAQEAGRRRGGEDHARLSTRTQTQTREERKFICKKASGEPDICVLIVMEVIAAMSTQMESCVRDPQNAYTRNLTRLFNTCYALAGVYVWVYDG